jgi:SpoVK/Ycf46/Vps4 family AAA+-type ATPase
MECKVGDKVTCTIGDRAITDARLQQESGYLYICQNDRDGGSCNDKLGYQYSWQFEILPNGDLSSNVKNLKSAEEPEFKRKTISVYFDTVILEDCKKEQIKSAISQIDNNETIFEKWGFGDVFEKGMAVALLFYGVPGTGKTLMAQAIADRMKNPILTVSPAEIETSTPGGAERNIQKFFKVASGKLRPQTGETNAKGEPVEGEMQKHILLFDECDSLITNRDNVGIIMRGQINTLLSELERFDGIVIFTTNSIKSLDPAMERRITSKIEFEFPNQEMRLKIWQRMIPKKAPIAKDVNFEKMSEFPLAGGNIKNVVLNAARQAAYAKKKTIDYKCFLTAVEHEAIGMKAFEATYLANNGRPKRIGRDQVGVMSDKGIEVQNIDKVEGDKGEDETIE